MFAELLGRETGYNRGRGGSMHIADLSLGIYGANGIVGAHTFSVTLAEHNEAVVVCRELGYCG